MRLLDLRGPGMFGRCFTGVEEGVAIAGLVTAAVGTAYGVMSARNQGSYQVQVEDQNRKTALISAADAIHRGDIAEENARERTRQIIGSQRAAYAASGVDLGTGSPVGTVSSTAGLGELDALTIKNNAQREAWGFVTQAQNIAARGQLYALESQDRQGSTLLTGGSRMLSIYSEGLRSGAFGGDGSMSLAG